MEENELRPILATIFQLLLETRERQFQLDKMARCAQFALVEGASYEVVLVGWTKKRLFLGRAAGW
jgi:hypothetical protein